MGCKPCRPVVAAGRVHEVHIELHAVSPSQAAVVDDAPSRDLTP